ncbi:UDP-glycosyltransferase [Stylosanthes scabra]|uniref:Glycosyltransferase n=1 Tax=Stylosanthes scabra TaxID=79078 RepID=A0ABU6SYM6_9FABA|nr:UDP-glycosyltransferase [Stylosanthes scabra]
MASETETNKQKLHFVVFPLMSPGHMLPMIDIATILAHQHNVLVTVVTTPHNASRVSQTFSRASDSGLNLRLEQIYFPSEQAGFPQGCENFDMLPSMAMAFRFFSAASDLLQEPAEKLFEKLTPKPNCIISDVGLPYTSHIAAKFNVPRISFYGVSCFCLSWNINVLTSNVPDTVANDSDYFPIPGIPHKIMVTKAQIPGLTTNWKWQEFVDKMGVAEMAAYGTVVNSFQELEPTYARDFKKAKNGKLWCIGPVSLRNKDHLDKAQRGNKASIDDEERFMKWLDSQETNSVIYVCLGSMCNLTPLQFIELAMALEESNRPFIWAIRERNQSEELNEWIKQSGFDDRIKGRGLLIRGWAPQVLILSHPSVGGFLTHCGWNSTLEAICAGVPMLTWPLFGDQFFNERFVVEILRVGVSVGVESPVNWGEEEETGVLVKKEDVKSAIEELMVENKETEDRRKRAKELAEMAKSAVEEGGSSHQNVNLLIQDIMEMELSKKE